MDALADDGMEVQNYYAKYVARPADLPSAEEASKSLAAAGNELVALRSSPLVPDYTGPMLFDAPAAGSLLAQILPPSLSGARGPLSMLPRFDEMMQGLGGRSEWTGRVGTRVLPNGVSLVDDPTVGAYQGKPVIGGYDVDDEGVRAQRVSIVDNGILKDLLMSRRPGPESYGSNGHARSALLSDSHALPSNLIFESNAAQSPADLKKKFLSLCKDDGHEWCIEVRRMDNPAISSVRQEDFNETVGATGGRNFERRTVAAGAVSRVRFGRARGIGARRIVEWIESAIDPESSGRRQRRNGFRLSGKSGGRICRDGARRFWIGAGRDSEFDCGAFAACWRKAKCADSMASRGDCLWLPSRR